MKIIKPIIGICGELFFCCFFLFIGFVFSAVTLLVSNPRYSFFWVEKIKEIF